MSIPTDEEILALLDRLDRETADYLESLWLDFKPWSSSRGEMKVAVEYATCFANAEGGLVVFDVADQTRGRERAIAGVGRYDQDVWLRGIYEATTPRTRYLSRWTAEGGFLRREGKPPKTRYYGTSRGTDCIDMSTQYFFTTTDRRTEVMDRNYVRLNCQQVSTKCQQQPLHSERTRCP